MIKITKIKEVKVINKLGVQVDLTLNNYIGYEFERELCIKCLNNNVDIVIKCDKKTIRLSSNYDTLDKQIQSFKNIFNDVNNKNYNNKISLEAHIDSLLKS